MESLAVQLLRDLITNCSKQDIYNFLYINCAFTDEEIEQWYSYALDVIELYYD